MSDDLQIIGEVLTRLDQRRHINPATLELSRRDGAWCAMILADPKPMPWAASGDTPESALRALTTILEGIDWRRVRR